MAPPALSGASPGVGFIAVSEVRRLPRVAALGPLGVQPDTLGGPRQLLLPGRANAADETHGTAGARGLLAVGSSVAAAVVALAAHRGRRARRGQLLARRAVSRRARGGEEASAPAVVVTAEDLLPEEDRWIAALDLEGFGREVGELGRRLEREQGEDDIKHLHEMVLWSDVCAAVGLATMWMEPNVISVVALSLWTHSRWTMIGHHCSHGGYNRTDATGRYSSRGFALGSLWRRAVDWLDWMLPEAWGVEHNQLHHYRLGEDADPDLVERNILAWGGLNKDVMTLISMFVWKWYYYAPNTYKELKVAERRRSGEPLPDNFDPQRPFTLVDAVLGTFAGAPTVYSLGDLVLNVVGPYFLTRFVLMPLPFLMFGPAYFGHACVNLLLAELLSNVHDFVVITTNHAGEDLYRFERSCKPRSPTFYLRAVVSSANFTTGGNVNDFMHGWLNYQIEHHVWPNLSMLAYQKGQPELEAICRKYGVPYVQEDVFTRLRKTVDIFTGRKTMRRYPDHLERAEDMMLWSDEKELRKQAAAPVNVP